MTSSYSTLHERVFGRRPPAPIAVRESDADVINPGRGFIGAFDYTMQLQVGCPGGCIYCYVPASFRLTPPDMQRTWGGEVRIKRQAARKFRRHLNSGRLADKTVYWSGVTDPYASMPKLTRSIWQILNASEPRLRPRRIAVQSRYGVDRDVDMIGRYCQNSNPSDGGPPVVVSYSIGTDHTKLIREWERATPSFERRMQKVKRLCRAGMFVVVTLSPFGHWYDLKGTLRQLDEWGVAYVTVLFFKQKQSCATTPAAFLHYLSSRWPCLLDPSWQADRLHEIRSVFSADRVLVEQDGFSSLVAPQHVA